MANDVDKPERYLIRDTKTEWIEGMNENGCGIVNSTLNLNEGKVIIKFKNSIC
jgi:hypothetical protein